MSARSMKTTEKPEAAVDDRVPYLSLTERDRRWELVRGEMEKRGLDCLMLVAPGIGGDMANIAYLTSVYKPGAGGALAVFPQKGEVTVHMGGNLANIEMWRHSQDWIKGVLSAPQPISFAQVTIDRLKEMGLEKGRVGVVSTGGALVPDGGMARIYTVRGRELLPQATWEDTTDLVDNVRVIKSGEEIALIQKASDIGDRAIEVTAQYAKAGVRSKAVYARLISAMVEGGSELPFILWDAGPSPVHGVWIPDNNILRPGYVIMNEFSPFYRSYEAQFQRPMAVGYVPDLYARLFDAAFASYRRGLETLKPGKSIGDVVKAMAEPIQKAGFITITPYFHGLNPFIPIAFSHDRRRLYRAEDQPKWNEFQGQLEAMPVRSGMVLAFEPNAVTPDQRSGVHLGDSILVTQSGNRRMSQLPMEWFIV